MIKNDDAINDKDLTRYYLCAGSIRQARDEEVPQEAITEMKDKREDGLKTSL